MSNKGLYSTAGTQDNNFNLYPPQIVSGSILDELREKLIETVRKDGASNPDYISGEIMQLFSNHLEQETLKARIETLNWCAKRPHGGQAGITEIKDYITELQAQLTTNKSKEK